MEPDKQGRILIPQPLRDYASIEKDVTFIGTGDRAEIWSTECWTQFNDNLTEDSIAEAMDALSLSRGGQSMAFVHKSVLFHETIDALNIRPDGIYVCLLYTSRAFDIGMATILSCSLFQPSSESTNKQPSNPFVT